MAQSVVTACLLGLLVCVAGLVYPFRPFGTRRRAGVGAVGLFGMAFVAALGVPVPGAAPGQAAGAQAGMAVDVPSDPKGRYRLVDVQRGRPGFAVITTERNGPSGQSFAVRECSCPVQSYRYLGDAATLAEAKRERATHDTFADLVHDGKGQGSVSYHVCVFACRWLPAG